MEAVVKNVRDLPRDDRSALERVVGHELQETQQVVVQVLNPPVTTTGSPPWAGIYDGLSDEEVDQLDSAIRQRANLTRDFS